MAWSARHNRESGGMADSFGGLGVQRKDEREVREGTDKAGPGSCHAAAVWGEVGPCAEEWAAERERPARERGGVGGWAERERGKVKGLWAKERRRKTEWSFIFF